jgi:hypothetical protein
MRRWLIRLLLILLVLVVGAFLAVHITLHTDLPRRMVVDALQEETGLRVTIGSLRTGWRGRTELRDVTLALPLETDPFARIPAALITHTDLLRLLVLRDARVRAIELAEPWVLASRDAAGRWNLADVLRVIEEAQAARAASPATPDALPRMHVHNAVVEFQLDEDHRFRYAPVSLTGEPVGAVAWAFEATLDQATIAQGRLAPRANWSHDVAYQLAEARPLIEPWLTLLPDPQWARDELPQDVAIAGRWRGELRETGFAGRLSIAQLRADDARASGEVRFSADERGITAEPMHITITYPDMPEHMRILGGRITVDDADVIVTRLIVEGLHTTVQIDGRWEDARERGRVTLRWSGTAPEWQISHEGAVEANFELPRIGRKSLDAAVTSRGDAPQGRWHSRLQLALHGSGTAGREWDDLTGRIDAPQLVLWAGDQVIDISGLAARLHRQGPLVRLTHLDIPQARSRGEGAFNLDTRTWSLSFIAQQWHVPGLDRAMDGFAHLLPLDVHLHAAGDPRHLALEQLRIAAEQGEFSAEGAYRPADDEPLDVRAAVVMLVPPNGAPLDATLRTAMAVRGRVEHPLRLRAAGHATLERIAWDGRPLEDIAIPLRGEVTGRRASFESDTFAVLDGRWQFAGHYEHATRRACAALSGDDASIERIVALLGVPIELGGMVSTSIDVVVPDLDVTRTHLEGSWRASGLHGAGLRDAAGDGRLRGFDQRIELRDMQLEHDGGLLTGEADFDLRRPGDLTVNLAAARWAVQFEDWAVSANVDGQAQGTVNIADLTAKGHMTLTGDIRLNDRELIHAAFTAAVAGRTFDVTELHAQGLGGELEGSGQLVMEGGRWAESFGSARWSGVDLALLARHWPRIAAARGISSGRLSIAPATEPRPPEPMQVSMFMAIENGAYRDIELRQAEITGFLGRDRFMVQRGTVLAVGGAIETWGRITQHEGEPFVHAHVSLDRIMLEQIVDSARVLDHSNGRVNGRVSGWISGGGYVREPHRLFGQGNLTLAESDLVAAPGIATVYDMLNVDWGRPEPTGRGEVLVRLEGNAVDFARITYFNRGTDIVARLRIADIWKGPESEISGIAAGVVRPLRDLDLPFVGRLDRFIGAIQAGAVSVYIGGTLDEQEVTVAPLAEVTGTLGRILRGMP